MSNSNPNNRNRHAPSPPEPKPMPPSSWAKKTGFRPKLSGETNVTDSGPITTPPPNVDLEAGRVRTPATANGVTNGDKAPVPVPPPPAAAKKRRDSDGVPKSSVLSTNGQAPAAEPPPRRTARHEEVVDGLPADDDEFVSRHSHMKYELRDSPGLEIQAYNEGAPGGYNYWRSFPNFTWVYWTYVAVSKYLRKISVLGHRIFLIYAVPLGLAITWAFAFMLTEAGVYSYKGCDANIPSSNMVSEHCRKHFSRMRHCRVDTSQALKSSSWFRFPYPLQWGTPVFHWKMAIVMCVVSLISSVDSVGSYHASSLLVASRPPTPGVLSRGIGLEGLASVLAGLWGTGTGSTTLTENVHTIAVTKMGSRRAVQLGACFLIVLSLIGKVGGFIASIPEVMVAGLLCFMWAMLTALGLSNLRYSEAGSSRNIIIVGLSLFFSLSIPAYFQQYGISPNSNLSVPSYFQPYIVTSHGPFHSKYGGLNYVLNTLFSLHMVIAFLVAFILDNTVPGSKQERGVYVWSEAEIARREPAVANDYELPLKVGRIFRWVKWVGV
ncbi:nucleobase-ascorbate transporter 12 isoform X2 [Glycine max]|uniref:nucleobase-ascorbate transporter 12 isoform X2 n=1 Tax=Glycine max TaxID=3847 RepID=UPI0003DEB461|nr:nucleobase-ascorbate transporter 12 isoform X2 [Glycine max]|eukprot:XP_006592309.1 nucleobase-ascorbate transporter 12 isoform X2 [Glycine max]